MRGIKRSMNKLIEACSLALVAVRNSMLPTTTARGSMSLTVPIAAERTL